MKLEDLNLPDLAELTALLEDPILRFFEDDEHVLGEDCPCSPSVRESSASKSGLLIVHNKYNLVPRSSLCSLEQ